MHEMCCSYNNEPFKTVLYCVECIDYITEASWNDEEWGPYPSRLQHRRGAGGSA
jgi:hypothetical protein